MSPHHCNHDHHHPHPEPSPASQDQRLRQLRWALVLTGVYFIAELVGGFYSGSLALLADAGHMMADVAAIALALFAAWIGKKNTDPQKTYGYYRFEILAAFINGLLLVGISCSITYEAYQRFYEPQAIESGLMMVVALGGLIINLIVVNILHGSQADDLNMKGAYLHVLGDLLGSVGALTASVVIFFWGWTWIDPILSVVISLLILWSAVRLLMEAVDILLESSPAHIAVPQVQASLENLDGVLAVHDLHVWTIASHKYALSAHVVVSPEAFHADTLSHIQHHLKTEFGLSHATIQLEPPHFEEDDIHF